MTRSKTTPASLWSRFRIPLILGSVVAGVALLSLAHLRDGPSSGTNKGATELLQIGALPVT